MLFDDCPEWVKETVPDWVRPYLGKDGLSDDFEIPAGDGLLCDYCSGVTLWQANHFIVHRDGPEHERVRRLLYEDYTPLTEDYHPGTLPLYERIVEKYAKGGSDTDKAVAMLTEALPRLFTHISVPPVGPAFDAGRDLDDEGLLRSGTGLCHDQARIFIRLCQVAGIPARFVFLFYSDRRSGHTIVEFYADGRWAMADSSIFRVFLDADGTLMSARECHACAESRARHGEICFERYQEYLGMPDEELAGRKFAHIHEPELRQRLIAEEATRRRGGIAEHWTRDLLVRNLAVFALLNYPLPK